MRSKGITVRLRLAAMFVTLALSLALFAVAGCGGSGSDAPTRDGTAWRLTGWTLSSLGPNVVTILDRDGPSARGDQVVDLGRAALLRSQPAVDLIAKRLLLPYSASAGMPERRCIRRTSTRNALKRLWLVETASGWPPTSTSCDRQRHRQPPRRCLLRDVSGRQAGPSLDQ